MNELAEFTTQLNKLEELIEKFENQDRFEFFENNLKELKESQSSLQGQNQIDLENLNSRIHKLIGLYEELGTHVRELEQISFESEIKTQNAKLDRLSLELNNVSTTGRKETDKLKAEIKTLEKRNESITDDLTALTNKVHEYQKENNSKSQLEGKFEELLKNQEVLSKRHAYSRKLISVSLLIMWLLILSTLAISIFY